MRTKMNMMLLLLIAGCAMTQPEMSFETYGGFTPQDRARQLLVVEPGIITYTIYSFDDEVTFRIQKPISTEQYDGLVKTFNDNGFSTFDDSYNPDIPVPDVGAARISFTDTRTKSVVIDPFILSEVPIGLQRIVQEMMALVNLATALSESEAESLAEEFISTSATFAFDGSALELKEHILLESYPTQHMLTYTFTSAHPGYGDRSGQILLQVVTEHSIKITIINGEIVSAVIDGKWDEIGQMTMDELMQLQYQPMQCVQTPWELWQDDGNSPGIADEDLIVRYYQEKFGIAVDVTKVTPDRLVCAACEVCPRSYYFTGKTYDPEMFLAEGWA